MNEIEERRKEILHEICKIVHRDKRVCVEGMDIRVLWFESILTSLVDVRDYLTYGEFDYLVRETSSLLKVKENIAKNIMELEAPTLDLCWLIKNDKITLNKETTKTKIIYCGTEIDLHLFNLVEISVINHYLKEYSTRQTERNLKKQEEEKKVKRQALEQLLCGTTSNEEKGTK